MRAAVYARVSTTRQAQAQTIEQQLDRLRAAAAERGWELEEQHVYRDDGYSGASLGRPGLDRLRDHAALADVDLVLVMAPDRLARNYVHQVLLIDELAGHGCQVEFLDRPMSSDPHDQLLLQIRGAVAEYERYAELGIAFIMPTARLCRPGSWLGAFGLLMACEGLVSLGIIATR
jgi:site-specific DNA recombinase